MTRMMINLEKASNGKMKGIIAVCAWYWETRYSWGHSASVEDEHGEAVGATIRYYNRTWERYTYESVIHSVLEKYVKLMIGVSPYAVICERDKKPMKGKDAERRRLERIAVHEAARSLYRNLVKEADSMRHVA